MSRMSGAEAMVRMLQLHGVKHIFGLCGDTSLPFYDALYRLDHGMQHILTRDERSAAYMADGYARVSGRVGVCEGPSGGGATYLLPGIVEANESSIPVLGITTDIAEGEDAQQVVRAGDANHFPELFQHAARRTGNQALGRILGVGLDLVFSASASVSATTRCWVLARKGVATWALCRPGSFLWRCQISRYSSNSGLQSASLAMSAV